MRVLALVTEAFGGFGGISLYNRDLLAALCLLPDCPEVVALPRSASPRSRNHCPLRLSYATDGGGGKPRYVRPSCADSSSDRSFDLIICGHINLLPLAYLARA